MHLVDLYLEELSKVRDKKTVERIFYQLSKLEELKPLDQRSLFELYEDLENPIPQNSHSNSAGNQKVLPVAFSKRLTL
jgi:hypothetical protein